jgi:hypothetical protein
VTNVRLEDGVTAAMMCVSVCVYDFHDLNSTSTFDFRHINQTVIESPNTIHVQFSK